MRGFSGHFADFHGLESVASSVNCHVQEPVHICSCVCFYKLSSSGHGRSQDFFRGETLRKFLKKFFKNCENELFRIFHILFNKPCVKFFRVWTKNTNCWEILRKLLKILKIFPRKIPKMHYLCIFFKKFHNPCVNFLHRWMKKTIYWRF